MLDDCEQIRVAIEAPFALRGNQIYTSVSIGVALATGDALAVNAEAMIREADTAMYQAKDAGRNSVSVFDASMRDRVTERLTLERDLHVALEATASSRCTTSRSRSSPRDRSRASRRSCGGRTPLAA